MGVRGGYWRAGISIVLTAMASLGTNLLLAVEPSLAWPRTWGDVNNGPTFRLRGRVDTDFIWTRQSAQDEAAFGTLGDAQGLRRARIGGEGNFTPDSRYVAEIDLASGQVVLRDLYAAMGQVADSGEFKFGHMREPFSLEGGTSANSFAFMERSQINTLDPARNWGVGFVRAAESGNWTVAGGLFQAGTNPSDLEFDTGSATAFTAKGTCLAWNDDQGRQLMHFGLALSERIADFGMVNVSQRPQSPLLELGDSTDSPFVPKLKIPASFQQLINAQWALVRGSFWTQAEWYGSIIDQHGGEPVFYHGSHLDAGYFVTGEHRQYLTHSGVFGPIIVNRPFLRGFSDKSDESPLGYGAWEVTGRVSYLDFIDSNTPKINGQPAGVTLPQLTTGLNWYLADRLRVMWNYSYVLPREANTGTSTASVFSMRVAVFW